MVRITVQQREAHEEKEEPGLVTTLRRHRTGTAGQREAETERVNAELPPGEQVCPYLAACLLHVCPLCVSQAVLPNKVG